jgi:hypothetical protein
MIKATICKFNSTMKSPNQMCRLYDWYIPNHVQNPRILSSGLIY